jgi:hypothetical protein
MYNAMRFVTATHRHVDVVAQLARRRSGTTISRFFATNNNSDKEKEALFRALHSNDDDSTTLSSQAKGSATTTQQQDPQKGQRSTKKNIPSAKKTARSRKPDGLMERIPSSSSSDYSSKPTKKPATLDDFFSSMGASRHSSEQAPPSKRQGIAERLSSVSTEKKKNQQRQSLDSSSSKKKKKSALSSFFDEVDAMVKKRAEENGGVDDSDDPFNKKSPRQNNNNHNTTNSRRFAISGGDAPRKSIFDAMSATANKTATTTPRSPNAYDQDTYDEYLDQIEEIMEDPKFLRKQTKNPLADEDAVSIIEWLKAEEPVVSCNLPTLEKALSAGFSLSSFSHEKEEAAASEQLKQELQAQHDAFLKRFGWNEKQLDMAIGALGQIGRLCAKTASGAPLDIAWNKLKETGCCYLIGQKTLINFLYVSSIFSSSVQLSNTMMSSSSQKGGSVLDFLYESSSEGKIRSSNKPLKGNDDNDNNADGASKEEENEEPVVDLANDIAMCHDLLYGPSEQSTSIRARSLVAQGRAKEAEELLNNNPVRTVADLYCIVPSVVWFEEIG